MAPPSARPTYTDTQLAKFLAHISLPDVVLPNVHTAAHGSPDQSLVFLAMLQKNTLATVPFEDLSIHYSAHHKVSIDPAEVFQKVVGRGRGRGGYCMELNCLFGSVLRSFGYDIYSVGVRVNRAAVGEGEGYHEWSHMVNIVKIGNKKYMVDVGFGANVPTYPLLLEHAHEESSVAPSRIRIIYDNLPDNTDPSQRFWIYQTRHFPDSEWISTYALTEVEFLPQDYEMMNFWTSNSPKSIFTNMIIVAKYFLGEDGELEGTLIMVGGQVKRRVKGKTEVVKECKMETERIAALEELFGIKLSEEETKGIRGLCTELKGDQGGS
ncbi:MAG: hypothetical protein Q9163_003795 [Psora crenata]